MRAMLKRPSYAYALLLAAATLTGCENTGTTTNTGCTSDEKCHEISPAAFCGVTGFCVLPFGVSPPDMATIQPDFARPADIAVPPDYQLPLDLSQAPDMFGQCPKDTKLCVNKCISIFGCCTNMDCPANGQTCQVDNTCQCPVGQRACGLNCIPNTQCCTNDDCQSKVCSAGTCANPSCTDGVANGNETDIDCGGGFCSKCLVGRGCSIAADCRSNVCTNKRCTETGFTLAQNWGGGVTPAWAVTADFNVDGKPDVVTSNTGSNSIACLLGRGDGSFLMTATAATGLSPVIAATADFNGDTVPDVVTANNASYDVSVLLGYGDCTFGPTLNITTGGGPIYLVATDVNADKKADIVVVNSVANSVTIVPGKGDGTFGASTSLSTVVTNPRWVTVGDFNSDGFMDLATLNIGQTSPYTMSLFLSKGPGIWNAAMVVPLVGVNVPRNVVSADYNGDGKLDLIFGTSTWGAYVYTGNGNGTFQFIGNIDKNQIVTTSFMAPVDLNNDKKIDLVTGNGTFLANGNGSFQANVAYPGYSSLAAVASADYNGDGKVDIAFPSANNVICLFGNGDGTFQTLSQVQGMLSGSTTDVALFSPRYVTIADVNDDGRGDVLATGSNNATLNVFASNANGTLQIPVTYTVAATPMGVAAADFNGDGKTDVAVASGGSSNMSVLINAGNGTFKPALNVATSFYLTNYIATGDFNADGKVDLVLTTTGSNALAFQSNGDGTFKAPVVLTTGSTPRGVVTGDFNADGFVDIATANNAGINITFIPGKGDGTFSTAVNFPVPNAHRPAGIAIADIDADGKLDVVYADSNSTNVYAALGTGNYVFANPVANAVGAAPQSLAANDFDGDGKLDFVTSGGADRSLSVLLGTGKALLAPAVNHDSGPNTVWVATGDINGDKKVDIAAANQNGNNISILLNNF